MPTCSQCGTLICDEPSFCIECERWVLPAGEEEEYEEEEEQDE